MRTFFWGLKAAFDSDNTAAFKQGTLEDVKKEFILQSPTEDWLRNGIEISQHVDIHSDEQTFSIMRIT